MPVADLFNLRIVCIALAAILALDVSVASVLSLGISIGQSASKSPALRVGSHAVILPIGVWRPVYVTIGDNEDVPKEVRGPVQGKSWLCPPGTLVVIREFLPHGAIHFEVADGPLKGTPGFANPENVFWIADPLK